MARHTAVGIDIGTHQIKVVVAEAVSTPGEPGQGSREVHRIIGSGVAESRGLHHGYITNQEEVTKNILTAVSQAEKTSGIKIRRAFISVGGIGLSGVSATGSSIVSRADLEITNLDLTKAQEAAETAIPHAVALNKKIINTVPVEYKADGKVVWGRVNGLKAQKLDMKVLFIMYQEHHLQDFIKAVEEADIEVIDVVAAPIAASFVTLSKKQKKAGCVLANVGAETLSMVVFENSNPISLEIFPIGGTDITNDIALGLKVSLEEAEAIKLGAVTSSNYSKKKLDEIISARLSDMFELIETHLKKIGRNSLLPAGIIITGGNALLSNMKHLAETSLKLPSQIAEIHFGVDENTKNPPKTKDPSWAVACGLALYGFNTDGGPKSVGLPTSVKVAGSMKSGWRSILGWISQFLP